MHQFSQGLYREQYAGTRCAGFHSQLWWEPWRCVGIGPLRCTHMNPAAPAELRRTLGFLTKKPCILLEDHMRPQPFVSLGSASNLCLTQTSARRQNRSLGPINYRIISHLLRTLQLGCDAQLYIVGSGSSVGLASCEVIMCCTFPCLPAAEPPYNGE